MGIPLVPGNHQDAWYARYEKRLVNLYEKYLQDDWQSIYVLLTLLSRSPDSDLRQRAGVVVDRARVACAEDLVKKDLLSRLLVDLGIEDESEPVPVPDCPAEVLRAENVPPVLDIDQDCAMEDLSSD